MPAVMTGQAVENQFDDHIDQEIQDRCRQKDPDLTVAAQRVHGLIAHKEDGAFLPPEVVLEVVKPLEVVMFMRDVESLPLYIQMKGRVLLRWLFPDSHWWRQPAGYQKSILSWNLPACSVSLA